MKIEKINSYLARDQFIVEIITDKGISGVGQSACWAYPEAVKAIVDRFKNILIGKDPFMIEEINQLLMRTGPFRVQFYLEQFLALILHYGTLKVNILKHQFGIY